MSESRTSHGRRELQKPRDQPKKPKAIAGAGRGDGGATAKRKKAPAESTIREDNNVTHWSFLEHKSPTKGPVLYRIWMTLSPT